MEDSRTLADGHLGVYPPVVLVVLHGMTSQHQPKLTQDISPAALRRWHKVRSELILAVGSVFSKIRLFKNAQAILLLVGKKDKLSAPGRVQGCGR